MISACGKLVQEAGYGFTGFLDPGEFGSHKNAPLDLLLVDINMPYFAGDDIVRFVREEMGVVAPIYLYSESSEEELQDKAKRCGADGYICKGWGLDRLQETVKRILGAG